MIHAIPIALLSFFSVLAADPFVIRVVDDATGRGVPLVELRTTNEVTFLSDSGGVVAVVDPDLIGQRVYFHVRSHGYEFPKDGFGYAGRALDVIAGGSVELRIKRINVAERLYRVTGGGIYRDSVLAGLGAPIDAPLLNAQVFGSDSVVCAPFAGRIYWFWGDTNRPAYPLGNFHVPGATSETIDSGVNPDAGINLSYFTDENGFAKKTCEMPGEGPTWISGLTVLKVGSGRERMFASYAKIKGFLTAYERGIVEWDDSAKSFRKLHTIPLDGPLRPEGHPLQVEDAGEPYIYFASPFPLVRVHADVDSYVNMDKYEAFTCLREGTSIKEPKVDRDDSGALRYSWKRNTPPIGPAEQADFVKRGLIKQSEALLQLRDIETGTPVVAHGGSVNWNAHRKRWILIAVQMGGKSSMLGEVWYAEADTPLGPWVYARKVVTHDKYTFYNPKHHAFLDTDGGRRIHFEGTYASTFSGNPIQTPRYDYNQIMYALDLDDERLRLPVAVYADGNDAVNLATGKPNGEPRFFALDRASAGAVSVGDPAHPTFWVTAMTDPARPGQTALFKAVDTNGRIRYELETDQKAPEWKRDDAPLGRVWLNPRTTR